MMFTRAARSATAEASSDALSERESEVGTETGVAFGGVVGVVGAGFGFGLGGASSGRTAVWDVADAVVEVVATVSTTASVDDAFWIMIVGVRGTVALPNIETTKIPMRKIIAMPMWGLRRDIFIRYYQASRDTNICPHMLVRGKRGEEGWNILILKMVFSHYSGISLMVEQEISNLLVGVRFSHPAPDREKSNRHRTALSYFFS